MAVARKLCFVIMGFGKKTDFSTGKTFDLDQTYKNIIKSAVISCGYECVRADEIMESGIIDRSMYALLMHADLVIADISTYNPNAIYELGIRHAVRPFTTIILKENSESKIPFDLDHTRIFKYAHLGEDIGADEAKRCEQALSALINMVEKEQKVDSPLYEFVRNIEHPKLPPEEYDQLIRELAGREKHIFAISENALSHMKKKEFGAAYESWEKASRLVPTEPYFVQQAALCRYKSESPSQNTALVDALAIISKLDPDGTTNDPETLGITGAIYKNLWILESDPAYLDRAINYYGKGFKVRNDYYNGENYALCLNMKAARETNRDEKIYARMEARKTQDTIIVTLQKELKTDGFELRNDKRWIYATLSQCYLALGNEDSSKEYEKKFLTSETAEWEKESFYRTREQIKNFK